MTVLRQDLLRDTAIVVNGGAVAALRDALRSLGARLEELAEQVDESEAEAWARERAPLDVVVFDARGAFGRGGAEALATSLERCWISVRALAAGALIESESRGKIVLVAPSPGAGRHAMAARSALENLARTLSVEWARYGVCTTAVLPGDETVEEQLMELLCYLLSPAGDYFSGCRLELGAVRVSGIR